MTRDHATVWDSCLHTIRRNIPPQSFRTWFEPIKPVQLVDDALTIQVPNKFFYEWLEEHYVKLLRTTIRQELGDKGRLEYQILLTRNGQRSTDQSSNTLNGNHTTQNEQGTAPGFVPPGKIANPFVIPGIKKQQVDPLLNPKYRFENYIEGDCNKLARSAGVAVAKNPGGTSFNPMVVYGDVGLGKTHLAQAVGNEILARFPEKSVQYVSCNNLINHIIEAIKNNAVNDVTNYYQALDVLIVDDIQFLSNKTKTQDIFFHVFNTLHQQGKQIVLTSDRPPQELKGIEERLISRFKWGLTADLQKPDIETRMAILSAKMGQEGVELPDPVIEFICFSIKNNIRELEGVLVSLIGHSSLNGRQIDIELTREVIKNFVSNMNREITVESIQTLVAEYFSVSKDQLAGKTRKRQIVIARQLSMFLAKKLTDASLKAIGASFGGRDHSTVIHSCKAVQDLLDTDALFKQTAEDLEKSIRLNLSSDD